MQVRKSTYAEYHAGEGDRSRGPAGRSATRGQLTKHGRDTQVNPLVKKNSATRVPEAV